MTYRNTAREGPNHIRGYNMSKISEDRTCSSGDMLADRYTNRQTDTLIIIPRYAPVMTTCHVLTFVGLFITYSFCRKSHAVIIFWRQQNAHTLGSYHLLPENLSAQT